MKHNWFYNETIELISIPVTILAVIFGMYSSTIDQEVFNNENKGESFYEFKLYLDLFNEQIDSLMKPAKIEFNEKIRKEKIVNNHLIFIDLTSSISDSLDRNSTKFKSKLKENFTNIKIKNKVKPLLISKFLKHLFNKQDLSQYKICVWLYEGSQIEAKFYDEDGLKPSNDNWHLLNNSLLKNLLEKELDTKEINGQTTDFNQIFNGLYKKFKNKKNVTLTIFSDFYNDKNDTIDFGILDKENLKKLNVISFPHKKNKRGMSIYKNLESKFSYDRFFYQDIDLNKLKDSKYTLQNYNDFLTNLNNLTSEWNTVTSIIKFYLPNPNIFGYPEAKRNLQINTNNDGIKWRIIESKPSYNSKENFDLVVGGFKYNNVNKYSLIKLNNWHELNSTRNNNISLKITDFSKHYLIEFFNENRSKQTSYKLQIIKIIPKNLASIGKYSILSIIYLFIGFVISHLYKNYHLFLKYISSKKIKKSDRIKHFIIESIFILIYCWVSYKLFFGYYIIIIWLIAIIHFILFFLFYIYIKRFNYE